MGVGGNAGQARADGLALNENWGASAMAEAEGKGAVRKDRALFRVAFAATTGAREPFRSFVRLRQPELHQVGVGGGSRMKSGMTKWALDDEGSWGDEGGVG